jgi:CTP:molybdopterin cytidylyltransferase MocA
MSKWFSANKLALNLDKTNIIKFIVKNSSQHSASTGYTEKCLEV